MQKTVFSAKFAWKLKFHENRGKFALKHLFWVAIKSISGMKFWILDMKFDFTLAPTNRLPSQTGGTENRRKLLLESTSYQNQLG